MRLGYIFKDTRATGHLRTTQIPTQQQLQLFLATGTPGTEASPLDFTTTVWLLVAQAARFYLQTVTVLYLRTGSGVGNAIWFFHCVAGNASSSIPFGLGVFLDGPRVCMLRDVSGGVVVWVGGRLPSERPT